MVRQLLVAMLHVDHQCIGLLKYIACVHRRMRDLRLVRSGTSVTCLLVYKFTNGVDAYRVHVNGEHFVPRPHRVDACCLFIDYPLPEGRSHLFASASLLLACNDDNP